MTANENVLENQERTLDLKDLVLPFVLGIMPLLSTIFHEKWVPWYIVVILIAYLFEPDKRLRYQQNKQFLAPFLIMILVFVFFTLVSSDIIKSLKVMERQTSLLLLPAIICTSNWSHARLALMLRVFVFALALFCIFSFCRLGLFYFNKQDWINTMNEMQNNQAYLLFKFPHLVHTHPTYWSYLLVIGNIIVLGNTFFCFFKKSYVAIAFLLIFNVTLLLLASRTPLAINFLIHIFALVVSRNLQENFSWVKLFLALLAIFVLGIFIVPRISFLTLKLLDVFKDDRLYLWPIAFQKIKENYFILGEGLGLGIIALKDYIIENGDIRENYNSFDLHNQYLRHYLDMGILGLFSLFYLIVYPVLKLNDSLFSSSAFLNFSLVLLFAIGCCTEAPLYRLKGIVIFSIFYSTFLVSKKLLK